MATQTLRGLRDMSPLPLARREARPRSRSTRASRACSVDPSSLAGADLDLYVEFLESLELPAESEPEPRSDTEDDPRRTRTPAWAKLNFEKDVGGGLSCVGLPRAAERLEPHGDHARRRSTSRSSRRCRNCATCTARAGHDRERPLEGRVSGSQHDGAVPDLAAFLDLPVFNAWPSAGQAASSSPSSSPSTRVRRRRSGTRSRSTAANALIARDSVHPSRCSSSSRHSRQPATWWSRARCDGLEHGMVYDVWHDIAIVVDSASPSERSPGMT